MTEHCRFFSDKQILYGHVVVGLEITCENGYQGMIYVTKEPAFEIPVKDTILRAWHYELSDDGKFITLTGIGNNSIAFDKVEPNSCHPTVTNWSLIQ